MLTLGSVILAVINIGVMWAMAHRWRYAWHSNLALQLLWLPYDTMTKQYGLLGLGSVLTFVSLKACFYPSTIKDATAAPDQPQRRHPRRRRRAWPIRFFASRSPAAPAFAGTDAGHAGLLSSARGRHAAGRLSVIGGSDG